jgi:hypothetical protein
MNHDVNGVTEAVHVSNCIFGIKLAVLLHSCAYACEQNGKKQKKKSEC